MRALLTALAFFTCLPTPARHVGYQPKHDLARMLRGLILDAYKVPRHEGKRDRESASNDFADAHYAACLEAISNDRKN